MSLFLASKVLPRGMLKYLEHIQALSFKDKPNYEYLIKCLKDERAKINNKITEVDLTCVDQDQYLNDSLFSKYSESLSAHLHMQQKENLSKSILN
jgi:hypothetical protein